MTLISLVIAVLAVVAAANAQASGSTGSLTACDDCCTSAAPLIYGSAYFDGSLYGAFSVCSNGYILLLTSTSSSLNGYSYNPQPISQTQGSPMIAPFWSDNNLACTGTTNTVSYYESCDQSLLDIARSLSQDSSFNPSYVLVVEYDAVQAYTCPASQATNTYTIIMATDPASSQTYAIYLYQTMSWSTATSWSNDPTVGYSNGQGEGYQQIFYGSVPAAYVQQCVSLSYSVGGSSDFTQQVQAQNKGTLARQQKDGAAKVVMQEFAEKNGEGGNKAAMQDQLNLALQNAQRENRVVLQHFNNKN